MTSHLTSIIATLGPATDSLESIAALVEAGACVFRLNFSHGTLAEHGRRLAFVRDAEKQSGRPLGVLGDLQGPKIRLGVIAGDGVDVVIDDEVIFERGTFVAAAPLTPRKPLRLACTYPGLVDDVQPEQRLLINDGAVQLVAVARTPYSLGCRVVVGGRVTSNKGVNLPDTALRTPSLSEHDRLCVAWAIEQGVDWLALSFVRSAEDLHGLRQLIGELSTSRGKADLLLPIIAKIERPEAVAAIDSIVDGSDAIMVARGDLGVEMDVASVPITQKRLMAAAHAWGKPCIVATQMLQSMIDSPQPTRAEAGDVATAIFDGADAVMLSGETAVGRNPRLVVETMRRIAQHAEAYVAEELARDAAPRKLVESGYRTAALAHGAWHIVRDNRAACVAIWSQQGGGARYLSQNDFAIPIVAFSNDLRALRRMTLYRGVYPVAAEVPDAPSEFARRAEARVRDLGFARDGDRILLVYGEPFGVAGVTNTLALHTLAPA